MSLSNLGYNLEIGGLKLNPDKNEIMTEQLESSYPEILEVLKNKNSGSTVLKTFMRELKKHIRNSTLLTQGDKKGFYANLTDIFNKTQEAYGFHRNTDGFYKTTDFLKAQKIKAVSSAITEHLMPCGINIREFVKNLTKPHNAAEKESNTRDLPSQDDYHEQLRSAVKEAIGAEKTLETLVPTLYTEPLNTGAIKLKKNKYCIKNATK